MKKFFVIIILLSLLATNAFALQEVAGRLVVSVPIGGSNSTRWGLLNDGNDTINVSISADNNTVNYLSFPSSVVLQPKKLVYVNITASIPADYGTTGNITGYLYALQEGASGGQVQINVQMMKGVTIEVYGQPKVLAESNQAPGSNQTPNSNQASVQAPQTTQTSNQNSPIAQASPTETSPTTGYAALIFQNFTAVVLIIALFIAVFVILKTRKIHTEIEKVKAEK